MLLAIDQDLPRTIDQLIAPGLAAKLDRLDLLSRKILSGRLPGERRSKRRGRSVEFDDFREYAAGDDPRHIDWNVYARLDRLFIKLFREEEDLALHLIVDVSPSMDAGLPSKLVFAARLAMALSYIGLVNHNRVSLSLFGGDPARPVQQLAPLRGRRSLQRVSSFLLDGLLLARERRGRAGAGPAQDGESPAAADFDAQLRRAAQLSPGRGITVVLSDFLAPAGWKAGLNALAAISGSGAADLYCVQVLSPGELDPRHESNRRFIGDLRLEDAEAPRHADITVSAATIARYRRVLEEHNTRLRADCLARGLAYFLVATDTPIDQLVVGSLRRGGMLR
ncbi:MAG: DUF58 domain-containing protein [Phycisphaerales bacterium]|nr:DUF58 domain-containing protein [Phycisphaerales bacterium]